MIIFNYAIHKILKIFGYKLQKLSDPIISINSFNNLALAYKKRLNELDNLITPNEVRFELLARLLAVLPFEAYFIVNALAKSKDSRGDVCEFGVAQGATSTLMANEIISGNKVLHLFDSFEGLPEPSEKDHLINDIFLLGSIEEYAGTMSIPEKEVRTRLKEIRFPLERVVIHKGFIDKVLKEDSNLPKEVSVAFVDFDFYEPIMLALNFLHQTTSVGAIIIVHDYDGFVTGTKTAVDEFLADKNASVLIYECFVPVTYNHIAILTRVG